MEIDLEAIFSETCYKLQKSLTTINEKCTRREISRIVKQNKERRGYEIFVEIGKNERGRRARLT